MTLVNWSANARPLRTADEKRAIQNNTPLLKKPYEHLHDKGNPQFAWNGAGTEKG